MDYNRNHSNGKNKWRSQKNTQDNQSKKDDKNQYTKQQNSFQKNTTNDHEIFQKIELKTPECEYCKQPITELATALGSKETGEPVHFDCALNKVIASEKVGENEKITYIGQGRFAVVYFENPHDLRHFTIQRIIEWENKEKTYAWRTDIAGLYSQVK